MKLPIGILADVAVTICGGLLGSALGPRLNDRWKSVLNKTMGIATIVMGIMLAIRAQNLSAAILALLAGVCAGEAIHLETRVNSTVSAAMTKLLGGGGKVDAAFLIQVTTVLVLFCFSGSGWYGALTEGLTGDRSILITKAILDGIAACIFATLMGKIIPCLCIPQLCILLPLFFVGKAVGPYITDSIIADFSAVGGIITLTAGLRLTGIKEDVPVLNLLPGLVLIFFISAAWTSLIG